MKMVTKTYGESGDQIPGVGLGLENQWENLEEQTGLGETGGSGTDRQAWVAGQKPIPSPFLPPLPSPLSLTYHLPYTWRWWKVCSYLSLSSHSVKWQRPSMTA